MKLTIKHLAGYLPYGLKFLSHKHRFKFGEQTALISRGMSLCDDGSLNIEFLYEDNLVFSNEMKSCKPILRPLFDLTKEIEVNGEKFVPIKKLGLDLKMNVVEYCFTEQNPLLILELGRYVVIEKLLEWHFDIHGLIENDLAIDINTLNKT